MQAHISHGLLQRIYPPHQTHAYVGEYKIFIMKRLIELGSIWLMQVLSNTPGRKNARDKPNKSCEAALVISACVLEKLHVIFNNDVY